MRPISLGAQVIMEYLEKYPNASTMMLARMVYRDNVALFTNLEDARSIIRHYRGACGEKRKNNLTNKNYVRPFRVIEKI
jgi:chromosome condensin MukBEF complex kleisin-like MukF subunit